MPPDDVLLATRAREIRAEMFGVGHEGVETLARELGLPPRTWQNYERGVAIPAGVFLRFLVLTGAEPRWLLTGEGERYRARSAEGDFHTSG